MPDASRIVVLTAREDLLATVRRLAALAGAELDVRSGSVGVRAVWRSARLVLVGSDLAGAVAAAGVPRRADVVVLATDVPDVALWRSAVDLGATRLFALPDDDRALVELISEAVEPRTVGGSTIAVIGGCGGAGASTLAAALAFAGMQSGPTVLIDSDRYGGGIDVLLGAEQEPGARWPDLAATRGRLGAEALAAALVQADGLAVLSWDRAGAVELGAEAAAAVMDAAVRGFRWVIVDLPRSLDQASQVIAASADLVVLILPATVRAVAASATVAAAVVGQCSRVRLVVRDVQAGHLAVAEIADALGLPVAATVHSESAVVVAAARGEPPIRRARGSLYDACRTLLDATVVEAAA